MRRLLIQKRGNLYQECEDALSANLNDLRFAVADGATEAYDSRRWARYVCHAWTSSTSVKLSEAQYIDALKQLGQRFSEHLPGSQAPWYVREKAEQGSFATFLGLELSPEGVDGGVWRATAIGDCCLMEVSNGSLIGSFPVENPEAFGSSPDALQSRSVDNQEIRSRIRLRAGIYGPGDHLILLSDAAAQWFLRADESDPNFVPAFVDWLRHDDLLSVRRAFETARDDGRIRNDDIALLALGSQP